MNQIVLHTRINAPLERCFDLSTSIDLHKKSAINTSEEAIDGITTGLIQLNQTVTWRAKHFAVWHKMKVQITEYDRPHYFVDEMVWGIFKSMKHKHEFKPTDSGTMMIDKFEFSSPFGFLGRIVDRIILINYMTNFLQERNQVIKEFAESEKWKKVLKNTILD